MDPFKELTELQLQYGYKSGELNPVALLGLFGEAGEVLDECLFPKEFRDLIGRQQQGVLAAKVLDGIKKEIRKFPHKAPAVLLRDPLPRRFDLELADVLYYVNLLALNRGHDLAYYAQLSIDKVKAKGLKPPVPMVPKEQLYSYKGRIEDFLDSQQDPGDENVNSISKKDE